MVEPVILFWGAHEWLFALAQQNRMLGNRHASHVGVAKAALVFESQHVPIKMLRLFEIIDWYRPVRHIVNFQHAHTYLLRQCCTLSIPVWGPPLDNPLQSWRPAREALCRPSHPALALRWDSPAAPSHGHGRASGHRP